MTLGRLPPESRLAIALEATTARELERALKRTDGNRSAAAAWLGVSRLHVLNLLAAHPEIAAKWPAVAGRRVVP